MHSRESSEYRTFWSSLQISTNESVGYPYQIANNGKVNVPSRTNAVRQTKRPRWSHLCSRAFDSVVPRGRLLVGSRFIFCSLDCAREWSIGEDFPVDGM